MREWGKQSTLESKRGKILLKKELMKLKPAMTEDAFTNLLLHQAWLRNHKKQGISETNATKARKFRKDFCEKCGATKKLVAHHINENQSDNRAENIQTLCSKCHVEHHKKERFWRQPING